MPSPGTAGARAGLGALDAVLTALPGPDKIRVVLFARCGSVRAWAQGKGIHAEQAYLTLSGSRLGTHVRDALAEELDLPREEIDRLLQRQPHPVTPA